MTNALAREYCRHEVVSRSEGLVAGDADDDSDDDGENNNAAAMDSIQEELEQEEEEESVPMIDPEGFETVARGKKSKKKNYKI